MPEQPTLVLLHSPLLGPSSWQAVARELDARGVETIVPSLTEVFDTPGPYYRRLAETVARLIDSRVGGGQVVLAGHSSAGAVLPLIAEATGAQVAGAFFVDALLPHPGVSWVDRLPDGYDEQLRSFARNGALPPWNQWFPEGTLESFLEDPDVRDRFRGDLPSLPLAYFEEILPDAPLPPADRSVYLRLSETSEIAAAQAERQGQRVTRLSLHHLALLTHPEQVSSTVQQLLAELPAEPVS